MSTTVSPDHGDKYIIYYGWLTSWEEALKFLNHIAQKKGGGGNNYGIKEKLNNYVWS